MSEERKWIVEREVPTVTKDGDEHILLMKSTIDECALKWAASEDAAIRASLVKLGWTPPESAALHSAERAVLDACVEQSKALDAVRARPGQLSALQRHTDAVRSLSIKVRSYRALIEAESK